MPAAVSLLFWYPQKPPEGKYRRCFLVGRIEGNIDTDLLIFMDSDDRYLFASCVGRHW